MVSACSKLIALLAALLAAAPPGACCWGTGSAASPKRGACCERKSTPQNQTPALPAAPKAHCCCQQPVTEQAKVTVDRAEGLVVALPAVAATHVSAIDWTRSFEAPLENSGPPLNLLHCVWRC